MSDEIVRIYTDGAAKRVGQEFLGGWGVLLTFKDTRKEISGSERGATNNRMELMAIYQGLKLLKPTMHRVIVTSDSQYCINAITNWWKGWERNGWVTASGLPVANLELIQSVLSIREDRMSFRWIKGHSGHPENDLVDALAVAARKELEIRQPA